jgi:ketosteroid isomerase-like protein
VDRHERGALRAPRRESRAGLASPEVSANVDKLRALYDAFDRRDFDAAVEYAHPDIQLHPAIEGVDTHREYRGRDGVRAFLEQISSTWEAEWVEFEEVLEGPDDRVFVAERWHVIARDGLKLHFDIIDVSAFRDGLVVRADGFRDRAEALAAAGLAAESDRA